MKNNTGFTLTEILTAVVIVTILVTMAVPLYEKTIERSRLGEARTLLAKLQDAKLRAMDDMGCLEGSAHYNSDLSSCPKLRHLGLGYENKGAADSNDLSFETDAFHYSIRPIVQLGPSAGPGSTDTAWGVDAVCARRLGGDYNGTVFLYAAPGVSASGDGARFVCSGSRCKDYGLQNANSMSITCN